MKKPKTRKAYLIGKDGEKQWFDIDRETAEKVIRLQKMFAKDKEDKV